MQKNAKVLMGTVHNKLKKHFGGSATILRQETCLKIKSKVLVDKDLEMFETIKLAYSDITIKRSDLGLLTILNFTNEKV